MINQNNKERALLRDLIAACKYEINDEFMGVYQSSEDADAAVLAKESKKQAYQDILSRIEQVFPDVSDLGEDDGSIKLYRAEHRNQHGAWRLAGVAFGHPNYDDGQRLYPSYPVSFDDKTDTFVTCSGNRYKILSYVNRQTTIEQIKKDIEIKGYSPIR